MGYESFVFWEFPTTLFYYIYYMHLLHYLLNDSQTIHFSKPLLCVTLICADWSISFKAELSVTLCTALPWKQIFVILQKVGGNMLMFHVDVKQGFVLKMTRFNDSESTLSFERRYIYTRNTFRCFHSLTHCMEAHFHFNRLTARVCVCVFSWRCERGTRRTRIRLIRWAVALCESSTSRSTGVWTERNTSWSSTSSEKTPSATTTKCQWRNRSDRFF